MYILLQAAAEAVPKVEHKEVMLEDIKETMVQEVVMWLQAVHNQQVVVREIVMQQVAVTVMEVQLLLVVQQQEPMALAAAEADTTAEAEILFRVVQVVPEVEQEVQDI